MTAIYSSCHFQYRLHAAYHDEAILTLRPVINALSCNYNMLHNKTSNLKFNYKSHRHRSFIKERVAFLL